MSDNRIALNILTDVLDNSAYLNLSLKRAFSSSAVCNNTNAKNRINAWVCVTIENLRYIDMCLDQFLKGKQNRYIKNIMRLGVAQLLYMNEPDYAVCNECVTLTQEIGKAPLKGYVNAILRSIVRAKDNNTLPTLENMSRSGAMSTQYGYPEWLISEYLERFGNEQTQQMLEIKTLGLCVRAQFPYSSYELEHYLTDNNINFTHGKIVHDVFHISDGQSFGKDIVNNQLFIKGKITVQSESSAYVCELCDISASSPHRLKILDACAAPGGKSANLASKLAEFSINGHIDAWELHSHRVNLINKTLGRLNITNVSVSAQDATVPCLYLTAKYDIVLCDVPCSGFGVVGKPDIRLKDDENAIVELAKTQYAILDTCANYVKPGGTLVYSTCTVSRRENEDVVRAFLSSNTNFLPQKDKRLKDGYAILLPHIDLTDGFFAAKLTRTEL